MENVFDDIADQNSQSCESLSLDISFAQFTNGSAFGISIEIEDQHAPIFISAAQLRALADEAESAA